MDKPQKFRTRFVADGQFRHFLACQETAARKVYAQHADELEHGGFFTRLRLRLKIKKEIEEELIRMTVQEEMGDDGPSKEKLY